MIIFPNIPPRLLCKITVAVSLLAMIMLLLSGCTICPDQQCPVFPNAAPRQ